MAKWSLVQLTNPWATPAGEPSMVRELTVASSRGLHFSGVEADTLSFTMPGNHRQTAALQPLVSDVLVFRDELAVQRFRVVSRVLSKDSGVLDAAFSATSYRGLLDAWVIHGTDQRSFPATSGGTAVEQTDIVWELLSAAQSRSPGSTLGITRGPVPVDSVNRTLRVPDEDFKPTQYFDEGMKIGEAIDQVATLDHGFAWDIVPDPSAPYTSLKFMTWTVDDGGRAAGAISDLLLNDGGSVASWSHAVAPADYANVVRVTGAEPVAFNVKGETQTAIWQNGPDSGDTGENPVENPTGDPPSPPEGRWELGDANTDRKSQAGVNAAAAEIWTQAHDQAPELTVTLARGRWRGPDQLWLGSQARTIITEPVDDENDAWILYLDDDLSVVEVNVTVDDLGAEDVSLSLNRPRFDTTKDAKRTQQRLARLERK